MNFFVENLNFVILIPLWSALLILFGKLFNIIKSKKIVNVITLFSALSTAIFALGAFIQTLITKGFIYEYSVPFIKVSSFSFDVGIYLDGVSAWMLLLSAVVSLIVQIYSVEYMKNDRSYIRFFAFINLFNFSMSGLVLSPNMFQMYIFWELVGVCSYLLIGFWYKKNVAANAAKKAFLMNRIGDFSLLSGIILSAYIILTNINNIESVALPVSDMANISAQIYGCTSDGMFIFICVLLLFGAVAKSAQFPLHTWLVDAMNGPTPVSALIHSATMVAAGVFLLIRLYPLFSLNNVILNIIASIGILTAIICSYSALTQTDIKAILAYSTNAQLGLMFLAVGCASTTVTMFHLTAHALAKAMLFLLSGSVIYALNSNKDIRYAGGLRKKMPLCAYAFLIGVFSLSGLLFAGFTSKEMILGALIENNHYIYLVLFVLVAIMTVYYLFRLYFYLFEGEKKYDFEINKSGALSKISNCILALFIVLLWFLFPKNNDLILSLINYLVALLAIAAAYFTFSKKYAFIKIPLLYDISFNAFYFENINKFVVLSYKRLAKLFTLAEKYVFDGIVYICTFFTRLTSLVFSKMQTGNVQSYLAYSLLLITFSMTGILLVYSLIIYFSEVQ